MTSPNTQGFVVTVGNGIDTLHSISIDVIVSQDGTIRLDIRSEAESLTDPLPTSQTVVATDIGQHSSSLISRTAAPIITTAIGDSRSIIPSRVASSTDATRAAPLIVHPPPAYTPGPPPPSYSHAPPPPAAVSIASSVNSVISNPTPLVTLPRPTGRVAVPASQPIPATLNIQIPHVPEYTRARGRASPQRRARRVPPPQPLVVHGPGFLESLIAIGLEFIPLKRRAEPHDGGRHAKRRRL
ncbi:hypothetical protein C8R43DRAFT_483702 [Mycena crocata]|nr:hypothetical protein C8R43DRAFT_483702 [Mycena crocata]